MEKTQSFSGGMNSDISPVFQPEGTYVEALNIEILNDELQGSVAISNSKGNKFQITIPDVAEIYKIQIVDTDPGGNTLITINGITNPVAFSSTGATAKDLYDYILAYAPYGASTIFNVYYSETYIVLYPIPVTTTSFLVSLSTNLYLFDSLFITDNQNLKPIGYGIIRDDIYLFTTNWEGTDPQTTGSGYGYIWKLSYNNITFDAASATLDLIYANDLNFTTYYNIPPTAVIGRYENSNTQRLYWTDNYNRLRSLNVADPQVGALDLSLLDVVPSSDFDIPLLTDIRSASGTSIIPIGCYQLAYKLSNTSGSTSTYSVPSNMVFVVTGGVGGAEENQTGGNLWKEYHGDVIGTTTTKRITWTINNLDRDYSRIEAVLLVRERKDDPPTIYNIYEGPIQNNSIDIVVDGDVINADDTTIVTLDEFLALTTKFTHCKTIGTKDNRLVVGNVRNELSSLDFDARAYRHKALNNFDIIENGLVVNYPTASYTSVAEESDAICPFNVETTDPGNYDPNSKYRADGVTLGGEGANISYEFMSIAVACDKTLEPVNPQPLPIVSTNPDYNGATAYNLQVNSADDNGTDVLQEYPITFPSLINDGMKYPQMNSIYWGYQHNEVYRVGIQFYDKSKNPYFVEWIGDIKFPDYFDTCPLANNIYADGNLTGYTDYRKSFTTVAGIHGSNQAYVCQLGLKLNVTIPDELTNKISGYSIVRVKREESDKRVIAEGLITNTFMNTVPNFYYLADEEMDYNFAGPGTADYGSVSFITPNILDANLTIPTAGMKLRISSYFNVVNALRNVNIQGGSSLFDRNKLLKMYNQVTTTAYETNIDYAKLLELSGNTTYSGRTFFNYSGYTSTFGNPSYLLVLNGVGITVPLPLTTDKYFAYIYNPIVNQYGGNTYADRANNEYILCSHFRPVKTKITPYTDTSYIFGGDVTNDIMDEERITPGLGTVGNPARQSTTFFFPASSPVNRFLRHGRHANVTLDTVTTSIERTDYFYNTVYSSQNDIVTFFPKPDPFIENTIYDNRFYISDIKINGELTDSWSVFQANNYWDVEGVYGPINSMLPLADKMYFWQDRAFGIIEINPRAVITDTNATANSELQVGTGLPLQRHDYISTTNGSKHQGSTIASANALYWYDANQIKVMRYSPGEGNEPLSDIKGLFSYLSKNLKGEIQNIDKPTYSPLGLNPKGLNGVVATYDSKKHRAIFTFHSGVNTGAETYTQNSFTVCLNELKNSFTTFYTFTPRIYINDNKYIISPDNNTPNIQLSKLYLHDVGNYCEFYDEIYDSYVKFIVNPNPQFTKVFDNIVWDSQALSYDTTSGEYINHNDDTWTRIRITDDYQNTDIQTLTVGSNIERKERSWQLQIPRNRVLYTSSNSPNIYTDLSATDKSFGERIRDKYIQVELWYNNLTERQLKTNSLTTIFRQSAR